MEGHWWSSEVRLRRRHTKVPVLTSISLISNASPMKSVGRTRLTRGHIPGRTPMDGWMTPRRYVTCVYFSGVAQ